MHLQVPERGHLEIPFSAWKTLASEPNFWSLVDRKILAVSQSSHNRMKLSGSCYVGRALFSDVIVELEEKIHGALSALLGSAKHDAFRVLRVASPSSELGPLMSLLIAQFVDGLRQYVSRGRDFYYQQKREKGSLVGGRIDVTRSIKLRARGLAHVLVFDRNVLARNTLKNRVLLAATNEIERIAEVIDLDPEVVSDARALALLFEDCRDSELLFAETNTFVEYAERLLQPLEEIDKDLLMLSSVILSHASFDRAAAQAGMVPRGWFLNLETLFEQRVRDTLSEILVKMKVMKGALVTPRRYVFGQEFVQKAEPDLVIRSDFRTHAVGDVKYKEWTAAATESDIYQLLVHTRSFDCDKAFLIFPHDRFEKKFLGLAATGAQTWLFGVDIRQLDQQLNKCIATMQFPD
jgi:5-methylcytosine-specific restriction endonuclease McrBC regulatory subunit McrC